MMPTLDKLVEWTRHYAVLQGVGDYRFAVSIVAGLTHEGSDAWAVVHPDPASRTATVRVRDIDSTPIPGFDGDPLIEIRVTLSHEMFHVLLAEWLANPTVENEERVVESAAQAVVRAEMGADARIVARSIKAMPTVIRARVAAATRDVSALASRRRGKGRARMDPNLIMEALDALIAGDQAKCAEILKGLVASAAGGAVEADAAGDGAIAARDDGDATQGDQQAAQGARVVGRDESTQMARKGKVDAEVARARKAADGAAAVLSRARVRELRTEGWELDAATERELVAERDPDVLERRIADMTRGRTMASAGAQRARSGVQSDAAPAPAAGAGPAPMTADQLRAEGFGEAFIRDYHDEHKADPKAAAATLAGGRARVGKGANPWGARAKAEGNN